LLLVGQDFAQDSLGPSVREETDQRGSPAVTASSEWAELRAPRTKDQARMPSRLSARTRW
jgi:hypothetical protein